MGLTSAQAKGRIKNIASKNGADPRVLMRIYMMERFLERVSLSVYKDNFIIKGGILITSILVRERANTRMRDFYDICVLVEMYVDEIKVDDFKAAYEATCRKRESLHIIGDEEKIIGIIENDSQLNNQWVNYQKKFSYASDISFEKTIMCAKKLVSFLR